MFSFVSSTLSVSLCPPPFEVFPPWKGKSGPLPHRREQVGSAGAKARLSLRLRRERGDWGAAGRTCSRRAFQPRPPQRDCHLAKPPRVFPRAPQPGQWDRKSRKSLPALPSARAGSEGLAAFLEAAFAQAACQGKAEESARETPRRAQQRNRSSKFSLGRSGPGSPGGGPALLLHPPPPFTKSVSLYPEFPSPHPCCLLVSPKPIFSSNKLYQIRNPELPGSQEVI